MADLHVTRHARETEYEKRIYNTLNKPLEELNYVTSLNRDYRPKAISEHSFFLYTIENSPMDLSRESQRSTNTSEFEHQSDQ